MKKIKKLKLTEIMLNSEELKLLKGGGITNTNCSGECDPPNNKDVILNTNTHVECSCTCVDY